jgi:hypothetical protein
MQDRGQAERFWMMRPTDREYTVNGASRSTIDRDVVFLGPPGALRF